MTDQFIGNVELVERPERLLLCFPICFHPDSSCPTHGRSLFTYAPFHTAEL